MTRTTTGQLHIRTIECPVCHSHGADVHHDVRSSLLYFCQRCQHEWQLDPAEGHIEADLDISPGPLKGGC